MVKSHQKSKKKVKKLISFKNLSAPNFQTYLVRVVADWNAKRAPQTEVSDLNDALLVDEQVLWFEIAMKDSTAMAEEHCSSNLEEVAAHQLRVHHFLAGQGIHIFLEVHREELEDQVQAAVFHQDILQGHDVWVLQLLQQRDLTGNRKK